MALNQLSGAQIKDKDIKNNDLADGSVDGAKVKDGSLTGIDIQDGSLTGTNIKNGSIGLNNLGADSVDGSKVKDGSLTGADIQDGSIALVDLASNSVDSSKIVDGSIALVDMASNSVDSSKIVDNSITSADIMDGAIMDVDINSAAEIAITKVAMPKMLHIQTVDARTVAIAAVAVASTANFIVTPMHIPAPIDINYVTTYLDRKSGTTNISLAIFDANGTKIWDSGARAISATGAVTFNLGSTLSLQPGTYYVGFYASTVNVSWWCGPTIGVGAIIPRHGTYTGTSFPAAITLANIAEATTRIPWAIFTNVLT